MTSTAVNTEIYGHLEIGKDMPFGIAGYYTPFKEVRLEYKGRQVLYVVGRAMFESSCCGVTGAHVYVSVPGYIVGWHSAIKNSLPASVVEPVSDKGEQQELARIIEDKEALDLVHFA